ncbi:hypothetical protein F5148DRAFT_745579 [Russula earlei]|uniref:Uncharacterized protein n=1 Tax=Russula earlei TaxID=71964 RepID=A0ACC0UCQ0_9AGAM|nr:hypothetical protein F5148DRAFT_745579 [Russula earlei]
MAQTSDMRQAIFISHPNVLFPVIATVLAFPALSPTPSFIPLTILVSTLLVYTRIVVRRPHAPRTIFLAIFGVSLASTLAHLMPSIHALSSAISSIASLWIISSASSTVALIVIIVSDRLSLRLNAPWPKLALFPALWATTWQIISHASPVGHLVTWSPVIGIASYEWMRPVFGTWGINWLVGAWAIVIAEVVGVWFIGPVEEFEPYEPLIPSLARNGEQPSTIPGPRHTLWLGAALLLLTGPSFSPVTPNLPWSASSTPLLIGCVLPHPPSSGDTSTPLDRFIEESKQHNGARLLLWPEAALRFETFSQREEAMNRVRSEIKGPLVGVTFIEPVPPNADQWSHSREGKWRNGLALVGPDGIVAEFYKRNLVPIAESFSLTESKKDPEMYELQLHGTKKNKQWTPVPPYDRTLPLTAAICLDFSSPTAFASLDSRPAVILAPAQTWHRDVSMAMWEQARARAEEAGGMVLFCDGGAQGASGVAGHGMREPIQFGSGSWTRTIGVDWPFDQRRKLYMWGGDALQVGIVWLLVSVGPAISVLVQYATLCGRRAASLSLSPLRVLFGRATAFVTRRAALAQGERQPLLL